MFTKHNCSNIFQKKAVFFKAAFFMFFMSSPNFASYLNQKQYNVVLFSNGSSLADQAWLLIHRLGFTGTHVMKGGLNEWIETIIKPSKPEESASQQEFEIYEFRKTASQFFGGGTSVSSTDNGSAPPPVVVLKKKKAGNVGGCE